MALGREAAKRKVKCFVELSTGMVYKSDSTPRKETDKLKPWSNLAKWKVKAEEDLANIEGLNVMVMRMAHVYGPYTSKFLSTALCMARVYQSKKKEMKWLWKEDLKTNTVHIDDTVRALWVGAEWYSKGPSPRKPAPIFNIVDHGSTCKFLFINFQMVAFQHSRFAIASAAQFWLRWRGTGAEPLPPSLFRCSFSATLTIILIDYHANNALQPKVTPPSSCMKYSALRRVSMAL